MAYSGMLRRVTLVRPDVSEELSVSFIRVTRIDELGTPLTSVLTRATRRNILEDAILGRYALRNKCDLILLQTRVLSA
jgi:hypothetical protein